MHHFRISLAVLATSAVLMLVLNIGSTGIAGATPMLRSSVTSHRKVLGRQPHKTATVAASSSAPAVTIYCDIYDYSGQSGQYFLLQSAVDCPVPATIQQTDYVDYCNYWNYAQSTCTGGWERQPGSVSCTASNVTFAQCPYTTPLSIKIPNYTVVRGDYVVTTTIPGSEPPTDTGTYYGFPYSF